MKIIVIAFYVLALFLPLIFFPFTNEAFEFNKIVLIYAIALLIGTFWLIHMIVEKKVIFQKTLMDVPLVIFLAAMATSSTISIDRYASIFGYYSRFSGGLLSLIALAIIYWAFVSFMNHAATKRFVQILIFSSAIVCLWAVFEHFGKSPGCLFITGKFDVACWTQDVKTRVIGTLGQPNWLAAFLAAVGPLAWAKAILNSKFSVSKLKHDPYFALGILLFVALLFTKSRSGFIGFIATFVVFWPTVFYLYRKNINKIFTLFALNFICLLLTAVFVWNPLVSARETPVEGVTGSGEIRQIVWGGAFELWKKYPLFGTGLETFAHAYWQIRPAAHNTTSEWNFTYNKAHNELLNYAATTGTVGLSAYLILVAAASFQIVRFKKKATGTSMADLKIGTVRAALAAGFASILVTSFFGFNTTTTNFLFFTFPAISFSLNKNNERQAGKKAKGLGNKQIAALLLLVLAAGYLMLTVARYWMADYHYAQKKFLLAAQMMPNNAIYRAALAHEYATSGEIQEALAEISQISSKTPRDMRVLKSIARTWAALGQNEPIYVQNEIQALLHIKTLAPTDAANTHQLAIAYYKAGDYKNALDAIEKTLQLKPNHKQARIFKEFLYTQLDI